MPLTLDAQTEAEKEVPRKCQAPSASRALKDAAREPSAGRAPHAWEIDNSSFLP